MVLRRSAFVFALLMCAHLAEAQYHKVRVASYGRIGMTWGPVPGATLDFTPASVSDIWILLLSAKLQNSTTAGRSAELRYLVNGIERGMGGANNGPANNPDGWQHFYRVTGTTAKQTVQVEIQALNSGASATVTDLSVVAFRLPNGADFQYVEWQSPPDPDPVVVPITFTTMTPTLTFTPSSPGNYLIMAAATGHEDPGNSFIGTRLRDPGGVYWPVDDDLPDSRRGHYHHGREAWRTFFWARVQNLTATSKTYAIEATGDVGGPNAEMRYHRLMAFRTDAFEAVESAESLVDELAPATTPTVKGVVTTAVPPGPRDYIIIHNIGMHTPGDPVESRNAGFEANDVVQMSVTKVHDVPELDMSYGLFDARTTSSSVKYENTFWTSNLSHNVFAKESVIHVLRLPTCSPSVNLRSIGTNGANLHAAGTATVLTNSTTVTFSSPLPAPTAVGAVGPGDRLLIEGETLFIKSRDSATQVTLQSPALADHVGVTTPNFTITRAHSGAAALANWETARQGNLVSENRREMGIVYNDGPFQATVTIDGSTTDSCRFMWLRAADGQRHAGVQNTGAILDGQNVRNGVIVMDDYSRVEWLEFVNHRVGGESAVRVQSSNNVLLNGLVIRDANMAIKGEAGTQFTVRNSALYRSVESIHDEGATVLIENCTVFGITLTDGAIKGTNYTVKNTISMNNAGQNFKDMPVANLSNCISSDGSASCGTCRPNRTATATPTASPNFVVFASLTGGSEDFHLQTSTVNDAVDAAADLSSSFWEDIDFGVRPAGAWDIGADELGAATAVKLLRFEAMGTAGAVELQWETGSELKNLGFRLHRAETVGGPYEVITPAVIPGLGSSPSGAKYSFRDSSAEAGVVYHYKLEDIETSGKAAFHGPVSAAAHAGSTPDPPAEERRSSSLITVGDPARNSFRVTHRDRSGALVELVTEGFFAEPREDGTVDLRVPGFAPASAADGPALPVLRPWVEALAGHGVEIASIRAVAVEAIDGLRPSGADAEDLVASRDGAVRIRRRSKRAELGGAGLVPEESARVLATGYQGDVKKAQLELAPLRWDGSGGRLVLTRRLLVHLSFRKRDDTASSVRRSRASARRVLARVSTSASGLHELRFEDLGLSRALPVNGFALSRQGEGIPYHVLPSDRPFGPGSRLYFVSAGASVNPYGNEAVYELESASGDRSMERVPATPSGEPVHWYLRKDHYEQNRYYQAGLLEASDLWFWEVLFAPSNRSFPFSVSNLSASGASSRLTVWLQGISDFEAAPDHHLRLFVNGAAQGELSWDGKKPARVELDLPPGTLIEGENRLEIENVGDTAAPYSMIMLDRFSVEYPRLLTAHSGVVEGVFPDSGAAALSGLSPGSFVLDVTGEPRWLEGAEPNGNGSLRFRAEAGRRYLAVSAEAVHRPVVRRAAAPRLIGSSASVDYLVIGPGDFHEAAGPLLAHRRGQGLKVKYVATEDVFEEFGYGERDPEALKSFISHAFHEWRKPRLRYVLLLGDATYDFKDYLKTGSPNQVPPRMVKTSYLWTVSDPSLAAVNGDDLLPDVAIGRLPAGSADELRVLVGKILAYESGKVSPNDAIVLAADNADAAGDFPANARELADGVLSGKNVRVLGLDELGGPGLRSEILAAFDRGVSLMGYVGHGGIHLWADENVFNTSDVPSLSAQPQQPLLLTMNCLNGYFHFPYFDSLAESVVKAEGRGAIAAFSPSGLSLDEPAHRLHQALLRAIFHRGHERLGDAVLEGQMEYAGTGAFPELLTIYHLLGDPALKLR